MRGTCAPCEGLASPHPAAPHSTLPITFQPCYAISSWLEGHDAHIRPSVRQASGLARLVGSHCLAYPDLRPSWGHTEHCAERQPYGPHSSHPQAVLGLSSGASSSRPTTPSFPPQVCRRTGRICGQQFQMQKIGLYSPKQGMSHAARRQWGKHRHFCDLSYPQGVCQHHLLTASCPQLPDTLCGPCLGPQEHDAVPGPQRWSELP